VGVACFFVVGGGWRCEGGDDSSSIVSRTDERCDWNIRAVWPACMCSESTIARIAALTWFAALRGEVALEAGPPLQFLLTKPVHFIHVSAIHP
jgi:hypothetical protein